MTVKLSNSLQGTPQPTQPKNTGMARLAHERLEFTVAQANRQHQNALRVDGATTHYWHKNLFAGYPCSCTKSNHKASIDTINQELKGGITTTTPTNSFTLRNSSVLDLPLTPAQTQYKTEQAQANNQQAWIDTDMSDEELANFEFDPQELAVQVLGDNDIVPHTAIVCGICKGYGRIGSLQLWQGYHVILDLQTDYQNIKLDGPVIETTTPYSAKGKGYIEWTVTLPQYFDSVQMITARNNTEKSEAKLTLIRSSIETDLTATNLKLLQGQNMSDVKIRAYLTDNQTITHVELAYQFAEWPVIAAPIWSANIDMRYENPLIQQQFELGANIPNVNREDLFWESKNNKLWKIISVDEHRKTSDGQVFGYLVTARLIQPYETNMLLAMVSQPASLHHFDGIDYKQGQLSPDRIEYKHFKTKSTNDA